MWFLLPLFFLGDPVKLLWVLAVFGMVFLHELGHSRVAQHFGIRVLEITFWPLGGMARMATIPESPRVETAIAIAGPLVNLVLAVLAAAGVAVAATLGLQTAAGICFNLVVINMLLGGFNLLPAFPMDGGRVLRAQLGRRFDWVVATERAVRVGRWVALAMAIAAIPLRNPILPFIAAFVWFSGAQELMAVRLRHGLLPFAFGGFGRRGAPAREAEADVEVAADAGDGALGAQPEPEGPERPGHWLSPELPREGGFGPDDVAALERYRGRLRHEP